MCSDAFLVVVVCSAWRGQVAAFLNHKNANFVVVSCYTYGGIQCVERERNGDDHIQWLWHLRQLFHCHHGQSSSCHSTRRLDTFWWVNKSCDCGVVSLGYVWGNRGSTSSYFRRRDGWLSLCTRDTNNSQRRRVFCGRATIRYQSGRPFRRHHPIHTRHWRWVDCLSRQDNCRNGFFNYGYQHGHFVHRRSGIFSANCT
jgi:hypothetical protein